MIRQDFTRTEALMGLAWLALGALLSLLLEVVYLGARLPLPGGGSMAFPVTILVAFLFNSVLARTARLWGDNAYTALVPLAAWLGGFFVLLLAVGVTGDQMLANSVWSLLLLLAGIGGGVWPLFKL